MVSVWLPALVSVLGAALAFVGARLGVRAELASTAQRERQGRREEWGRRFTAALTLAVDADERRGLVGIAWLDDLCTSPLAGEHDRRLAARILSAVVEPAASGLGSLDRIQLREDTGEGTERKGSREGGGG